MLDEVYGSQWSTPSMNPYNDDDQESVVSSQAGKNTKPHVSVTKQKYTPPSSSKKQSYTKNPAVEDTLRGISYGTHFSQQLQPLAYTLDTPHTQTNKKKKVHFSKEEKEIETMSNSGDSIISQSPYDIQDPECVASFRHLVQCKKCKEFMRYKMQMWWKTQQEANQMEKNNKFGVQVAEPFSNYGTHWKGNSSTTMNKNESIFVYFLFGCVLLVMFDWYRKFGKLK